jgi:hypothetical protein
MQSIQKDCYDLFFQLCRFAPKPLKGGAAPSVKFNVSLMLRRLELDTRPHLQC